MIKLGSKINYRASKKEIYAGIVVDLNVPDVNPSNENHGTVEVWLLSTTDYGLNNCEHFTYLGYKDFFTLVKDPVENGGFYVGLLLNNIYGKGMVVKVEEKDISIYLYNEANDYNPIYLESEDKNLNKTFDYEDYLSLEEDIDDLNFKNCDLFNPSTHCLELTFDNVEDYLIR